jgi:hypothetical protein
MRQNRITDDPVEHMIVDRRQPGIRLNAQIRSASAYGVAQHLPGNVQPDQLPASANIRSNQCEQYSCAATDIEHPRAGANPEPGDNLGQTSQRFLICPGIPGISQLVEERLFVAPSHGKRLSAEMVSF